MAFKPLIGKLKFMAPVKKPPRTRKKHFLREWRDVADLSQEEAAERAEIDRSSISKIEAGIVPYNQDLLEALAPAYGCEVADLVSADPGKVRETAVILSFRRASEEQKRIVAAVLNIDPDEPPPLSAALQHKPMNVASTSKQRREARRR